VSLLEQIEPAFYSIEGAARLGGLECSPPNLWRAGWFSIHALSARRQSLPDSKFAGA